MRVVSGGGEQRRLTTCKATLSQEKSATQELQKKGSACEVTVKFWGKGPAGVALTSVPTPPLRATNES